MEESQEPEPEPGVGNEALRALYAQATPSTAPSTPSVVVPSATPSTSQPRPDSDRSDKPPRKARKQAQGDSPHPQKNGASASLPVPAPRPALRYSDLGGLDKVLADVRDLVERPLMHPELYAHLGVSPPRGVLLHGPPGCGKTLLAHAIAGELGVAFWELNAPEVVTGVSGESEARLRAVFEAAAASAPSLIFLDELDAIMGKRTSDSRALERRLVAQLLSCLDELTPERTGGRCVLVLGATARPDGLDPALRRAGRFDRELSLGVPDEQGRLKILQAQTRRLRLAGDLKLEEVARSTPGYVGADLQALCQEAASLSLSRFFAQGRPARSDAMELEGPPTARLEAEAALRVRHGVQDELSARATPFSPAELQDLAVTQADFMGALPLVQPSSQREGFAVVPNVSWADVGALEGVRAELEMALLAPILHRPKYEALGLTRTASGLLLYGPPGCGKTLLAKAIASEAALNFLSVKGPELLNKYVGESEKAVRAVFARARQSAPCLIFFDEVDALVPRRDAQGDSSVTQRLVNQMLTELDGLDARHEVQPPPSFLLTLQVFVVAASNRPDMIDAAVLRPGRIDKMVYLPLPQPQERVSILKAATRRTPLAPEVALDKVGLDQRCTGYSGADCALLVREAQEACLRQAITQGAPLVLQPAHFEEALTRVLPSVTQRDEQRYEALHALFLRQRQRAPEKRE